MARFQERRKGTVKRLKDDPRERRTKEEFRKKTGTILRKLVTRLTEMIPEIQMEKAGRKFSRHTRRQESTTKPTANHVEECANLLDTLTVSETTCDVTAKMKSLSLKVANIEQEDVSFWEELEILNEKDFTSPEELENIEATEKELMSRFKENQNNEEDDLDAGQKPDKTRAAEIKKIQDKEMSSHEEDDQPLGISPTDTFFNNEYRKMMEGLTSQETNDPASLEDYQEETTPSSPKATPSSQEEDDNQEDNIPTHSIPTHSIPTSGTETKEETEVARSTPDEDEDDQTKEQVDEERSIQVEEGRSSQEEEEDVPEVVSKYQSPSPPPKKKQKMKQPTKKTSKSPNLPTKKPAIRKTTPAGRKMNPHKKTPSPTRNTASSQEDNPPSTPADRKPSSTPAKTPRMTPRRSRKVTPMKKEQRLGKIDFNFGRGEIEDDDQRGKVRKAKMQIEEKIRKEKRDKMLEKVRKPIILTPGSKRGRRDEGEWEQPGADAGTPGSSQAEGTIQRMKQTPIQSFLVSQTLEARRSSWEIHSKVRKAAVPDKDDTVMSASSASPSLRKTATKRTGVRKIQEEAKKEQKNTGKVKIIARYFEQDQKTNQKPNNDPGTLNKDNNNMMYTRPALGQLTSTSAVSSTSPGPEMSSQSGIPTQPMRGQHSGHGTKNDSQQPIEDERAIQHGLDDGGSHLRGGEGSE